MNRSNFRSVATSTTIFESSIWVVVSQASPGGRAGLGCSTAVERHPTTGTRVAMVAAGRPSLRSIISVYPRGPPPWHARKAQTRVDAVNLLPPAPFKVLQFYAAIFFKHVGRAPEHSSHLGCFDRGAGIASCSPSMLSRSFLPLIALPAVLGLGPARPSGHPPSRPPPTQLSHEAAVPHIRRRRLA